VFVWSRLLVFALALAVGSATRPLAQDIRSPILTIDNDRLYKESAFGKRVFQKIEMRNRAVSDENRRLEAILEADERALTKQRSSLDPENFRILADAFDARVDDIRREREAEGIAFGTVLDDNRTLFFSVAVPVLEEIMIETNAAVILEQRSVFVSSNAIDITQTAIERIDAQLGDGTTEPE
jgi:Skp family chaperone for outer membrane proteins